MPATSRKRNKGKDRKAKKEETERVKMHNMWQSWARGGMGGISIQCNHGFGELVLPEKSHPVSKFIDSFCLTTFEDAFLKHPEVKNDDNYRKMAADILTTIGANLLYTGIRENIGRKGDQFIINTVLAINVFENYDETLEVNSNSMNPIVSAKDRDLMCGSTSVRRDLLKFYRKRMSCSCLKKMHLEARKTQPKKLGACGHCNEIKERSLLMVCSKCRISQYCSRDCQVAASPEHRADCDNYVKALGQHTLSNDTTT